METSARVKLRSQNEYLPDLPMGPDGTRSAPDAGRISILEPPGTYTVKLTVGDKDYTQKLTVLKDPSSSGTEEDIKAQTKVVSALYDTMNAIADNVAQIESLKVQIAGLKHEVGTEEVSAPVRSTADKMIGSLGDIESQVLNPKITGRGQDDIRFTPMLAAKLAYLADEIASSDFAPTTQQMAVFEELTKQEVAFENDLDLFLTKDVVAFNTLLRERNAQYVMTNVKRRQRANAAAK